AISVALVGNTAVLGATRNNGLGGEQPGLAYVFMRTGATWVQHTMYGASDGQGIDYVGKSVAFDGETIGVGAPEDTVGSNTRQGSAYVFELGDDLFDSNLVVQHPDGRVAM